MRHANVAPISSGLAQALTEGSYGSGVSPRFPPDALSFANEPSPVDLTPVVASLSGAPEAKGEMLEQLERYKLVGRLGQGGMAEVFLAAWEVAPFVHRPVVIKRLHPHFNEDQRLVQMFLDEARLLTQLEHPNVVRTLEAGVMEGRCCIAMEYLEGQPLHRVLRRAYQHGGLPPVVAVSMAISVLDGLHYSHETRDAQGQPLEIVHRDISPQNVFVTNDGLVKVLDFGIAKARSQEGHTATGIVKGKIGYIAPEQAAGELVDRRADIWSTGVVLWESLAGARLFKAETDAATLGLSLQCQIPRIGARRPEVPAELDAILARALQRDRNARYQTAHDMRQDLELWLNVTGNSRDQRTIAAMMRALFSPEIKEQQRLVSVLMARSDCTPPSPASNRLPSIPSSTSGLIMNAPSPATSADLTRMNDQMEALNKRQRRAVRAIAGLLLLLAAVTAVAGYFVVSRLDASPRQPTLASAAARPPQAAAAPAVLDLDALNGTAPTATALALVASAPPALARPLLKPPPAPARAPATRSLPAPEAPSASAAPKAEVASFGLLTIDTSPWSIVSVGGRTLGQTPLVGVKLPAGTQVLSLKNPEQGIETSYPVLIESGKTTVRRIGIE